MKNDGFVIDNDGLCIYYDDFCIDNDNVCIYYDDFCIHSDDFCIYSDVFCIHYDDFVFILMIFVLKPWSCLRVRSLISFGRERFHCTITLNSYPILLNSYSILLNSYPILLNSYSTLLNSYPILLNSYSTLLNFSFTFARCRPLMLKFAPDSEEAGQFSMEQS